MARKAEEIQGWKNFFLAIKAVYGLTAKGAASVPSVDGTALITEKAQILHQRAEHFRVILNRNCTISDVAIVRMPQLVTNTELELRPLTTKT
ncbi:hypothetical protein SprV_0301041300 [Sparganum proliferum]